jgi:hypothetical protein
MQTGIKLWAEIEHATEQMYKYSASFEGQAALCDGLGGYTVAAVL